MGYDVGVYNSYGYRTISCSGFLRCSDMSQNRSEIGEKSYDLRTL